MRKKFNDLSDLPADHTTLNLPTEDLEPHWSLALKKARVRTTDLGLEKTCTRCGEWWPATTEFFYPHPTLPGNINHQCKGCSIELARAWNQIHQKRKIVIERRKKGDHILVVICTYGGRFYAARYPLDADVSDQAILRDMKQRGWGTYKGFFRRYNPVTGRYLSRKIWSRKRSLLPPEERIARRKPKDDHPWADYRRRRPDYRPAPDFFPQRLQSPAMQRRATTLRARAEARAKLELESRQKRGK